MNSDLPIKSKSQIGYQILAYLVENPEARDTLEGIVEWWLLERQIKFQVPRVKEALAELVHKGLILEQKGTNSQTHYRINKSKHEEIKNFIKHICG